MVGDDLPNLPGEEAVAVRHQGELLGALTVNKRTGESLAPIEQKLLDDLAHQAGLVLKNVGLTAELLARLEDLRASRQRLVAAQDEERRRLERNLHDGAQQHLVALKVKLGLAEAVADKDPLKYRQLISQLQSDADEALETLRDLARGIYPPLLADKGLLSALESQSRKASIPVEVSASDLRAIRRKPKPRFTSAASRPCRTSRSTPAQRWPRWRCRHQITQLRFEVLETTARVRHRLNPAARRRTDNMTDRSEALGGSLEVESRSGDGTRIVGTRFRSLITVAVS